jgi:predicted transcriptional regulator of viral defense system
MSNKKIPSRTLGPVSANIIYNLIALKKDIFSLDDACEIQGQGRLKTINLLRALVNRGVIARIKSGVFLILKMGQENTQLSNWPLIAHILAGKDNYYLSHYSAMRLLGMTTHPLTDVTITLSKRQKSKKIHNISYLFIYCKPAYFWGVSERWVTKEEKVYISDLERTILDGLERPDLCGGIQEVVRGIWSKQKQIDWNKLTHYAKRYHTKAAIKRLGFILEMLGLEDISLLLLKNIIINRKDYIPLDPNGMKFGKHLSRWHIQLNMNIDELKESIWG